MRLANDVHGKVEKEIADESNEYSGIHLESEKEVQEVINEKKRLASCCYPPFDSLLFESVSHRRATLFFALFFPPLFCVFEFAEMIAHHFLILCTCSYF